jgi:hypothetical protein
MPTDFIVFLVILATLIFTVLFRRKWIGHLTPAVKRHNVDSLHWYTLPKDEGTHRRVVSAKDLLLSILWGSSITPPKSSFF